MRGLRMVRAGNLAGLNTTVRVVLGGTVTAWLTVTGTPPPAGGAMVAVTLPGCGLDAALVMSALTVRAELARSGRIVLDHAGVAVRQRPCHLELDRELDAGVVVRRDLVPVHVIQREHLVGVVRLYLDGE